MCFAKIRRRERPLVNQLGDGVKVIFFFDEGFFYLLSLREFEADFPIQFLDGNPAGITIIDAEWGKAVAEILFYAYIYLTSYKLLSMDVPVCAGAPTLAF